MTRADVERRRTGSDRTPTRARGSSESSEPTDDGRPLGVVAVAVVVGLGGLADLATGLPLLASSLFLLGVVVAALGFVKLWVAVGLAGFRARALGLAILISAVSAMLGGLRAVFAVGTGGARGPEVLRTAVDVAVVAYLLSAADHFE